MDARESLIVNHDDPNKRVDDPKDELIKKLEAENQELRKKLRMAKTLLVKLDGRLKAQKKAQAPLPPCPVCGTLLGQGRPNAAEEEKVIASVEDNVRASRASRRPHPEAVRIVQTSPPPPPARPSSMSRKVYFTGLPFRFVFLLWRYVEGTKALQNLAMCNKEWARNARLCRRFERPMRLYLSLYDEERLYQRRLEIILRYKDALEKAQMCSELEINGIFANVEMLLRLSCISTAEFRDRFQDIKPGDSAADVMLIICQGLRVYATYYANFEVTLPRVMAQCKQRRDFLQLVSQVQVTTRDKDLVTLLKTPVERIESYRVMLSLLLDSSTAKEDLGTLQNASTAMDTAIRLMNETCASKEAAVALSDSLSKIKDLPALRTNLNVVELRLVMDGELVKVARRNKNVRLVLLNTCLIIAIPSKTSEWKCDGVIDCSQIDGVQKLSPTTFSFTTPDKSWSFQASSETYCSEWVAAFSQTKKGGGGGGASVVSTSPRKKTLFNTLGRSGGGRTTK